MKVLIFKIGALGDVLMSTPFITDLKYKDGCHLPFDTQIDYLVGEPSAKVLQSVNTITFDPNIFFKKDIIGMLKLAIKIRKEKYDMVFVLDKHWIFGLFAKLCGISKRYGFDRDGEGKYLTKSIPYNNEEHEIVQYKKLVTLIGKKPTKECDIQFYGKPFACDLPRKFVCIAVGGGSNVGEDSCIRRYPIKKFNQIIRKLKYPVVLVGGKEDHDLGAQIWKNKGVYNLIGATDLEETAGIMGRAEVVVCNDSGPMHLASAVNNKVISLFGPTCPKRKAPISKDSIALWKDQDIYEPEYEYRGTLPSKQKAWFTQITPDDIVKEVKRLWD